MYQMTLYLMRQTRMSKKRRLVMRSLPNDVETRILERVPVKSLLGFKAVSKQWKSTIESPSFQERQLKQREQSGDPDVLMVSSRPAGPPETVESLRTLVLGSSSSVKIPTPWEKENTVYLVSYHSCDGLVYLYHPFISGFVVNPATRWYRSIPLCQFQQFLIGRRKTRLRILHGNGILKVGFGKDTSTGTYKLVWLYNSSELGLENATTCEVFDFTTNAWRYVTPATPYRIIESASPVFVHGSLHWLTDCHEETKVVSFHLHTEAFQVICKAPFANEKGNHHFHMVLCNLDNRLCISHKNLEYQVIWSFNSNSKTWDKIYSINLFMTDCLYNSPTIAAFHPLALVDGKSKDKKKNLLYYDIVQSRFLLRHDPEARVEFSVFTANSIGYPVCYFPSLISI